MTCLCFSDSHGVKRHIEAALLRHRDAEVVFFLGDGLSDIENFAQADIGKRTWICVRGNCDYFGSLMGTEVQKVESLTLEGKRIVLTHGDLYGAGFGYGGLLSLAKKTGADIVLYGHTHIAAEKYFSDYELQLFNPGTAGGVRERPSYGVLTLTKSGALFSVINCE